jgi:molybdopterin-synthase adenylyltransferase
MRDDQLLRYSRQVLLPQIDVEGQQRLLGSSALIIGLGGLGSPVALYLAAAGVGRLVLADHDQVDLSNLQRQILHQSAAVGQPKVESAVERLNALNPDVELCPLQSRLNGEALRQAVESVDLVLDCTDNFSTRQAINQACFEVGRPLVSGAAIRLEGQISVFDPARQDSPCYECLYGQGDDTALSCSEAGVVGPMVGIVGALQALEALKLLARFGEPLVGRLLLIDGLGTRFRELGIRRDPACPCCGVRGHA